MVVKSWKMQSEQHRYPSFSLQDDIVVVHQIDNAHSAQEHSKPLKITASPRRADLKADPTRGPLVWSTDMSAGVQTQWGLQGRESAQRYYSLTSLTV
jgi:hypothetical protein